MTTIEVPPELPPEHDQVEANGVLVDAGLLVFLQVLWAKGLETCASCQGSGVVHDTQMAFIVFPKVEDAVHFLAQSAYLTDYMIGDRMVLSIQHPELDLGGEPRAKVTWLPDWTIPLVKAWG